MLGCAVCVVAYIARRELNSSLSCCPFAQPPLVVAGMRMNSIGSYIWMFGSQLVNCLERIRRCSIVGGGVTGTNSRFQKSSVLGPLSSLCGSEVSSPTAPGYLLPACRHASCHGDHG